MLEQSKIDYFEYPASPQTNLFLDDIENEVLGSIRGALEPLRT